MKLYERYGDPGFHTCLMTTFGIDFDAFESIVLPRLRGAGCFNNALLVDEGMLAYALENPLQLPAFAGRQYTLTAVGARGVFHPKLTLQLGRRSGRLIVASANLTASGLAGNLELAGVIEGGLDQAGERGLLAACWAFLNDTFPTREQGSAHQLDWMRRRTGWLFDTEPAAGAVTLTDGTAAALLPSGETIGIGSRFAALVDERPVTRLIVLSPYWDENLTALAFLIDELKPAQTVIPVDAVKALFPGHAAHVLPNNAIFDLAPFGKNRFIHAKAFIAETAAADYVLYGSANCTVAALGARNTAGSNQEACLYRRLAPGTVLDELGLTRLLTEASPIPPAALPGWTAEKELPLTEAIHRSPGRFECMFDTLSWWPSGAVKSGASIELLNGSGELLPARLETLPDGLSGQLRFRITGTAARPAFARVRMAHGAASGMAVVMAVDALREAIREARGRHAESVAARLSEETDAELWLLEALDDLEAAEADLHEEDPGVHRQRRPDDRGEAAAEEFRTLSYEEFVAGRRLRSDIAGTARNSLAGTELSLVRNFLNRILSIGVAVTEEAGDDTIAGLDLGDETADAQWAVEGGQEFATAIEATPGQLSSAEADRLGAARAKATRRQIVQAVERFRTQIEKRVQTGEINTRDVLRLRVMLMIVAAAAQPAGEAVNPGLQVLPFNGDEDGWPKLIGRVLFAFFGSGRPAIRQLGLSVIYDQLPDDILECWATCFWACQACLSAANSQKKLRQNLLTIFASLSERVYRLTGLKREELEATQITTVLDKLSARLGLDPKLIQEGHSLTIQNINAILAAG